MGRPRRRKGGGFRLFLSRVGAFLGIILAIILTVLISSLLYAGDKVRLAAQGMPSSATMSQEMAGGVTQIYSTDRVLLGEVYTRFHERVDLKDVPQRLQDATVAIEDKRFYEHPGIDLKGIARSIYKNAAGGRRSEGASTLTQQLVRNVILRNREKTVERKLREALLAYQIERSMTKDQILERYLNDINYGGQIFGVKMSAKLYFGKELKDITISEAALIAGLVQSPLKTYPFRHPEAAMERRNTVLITMLEQNKITRAQYDAARAEKIKILPEPPKIISYNFKAPHFVRYVLKQLVARHGGDQVYNGGLKIYTTLNWEMQQRADEILRAGIRGERGRGVTEGALICLEPHTGWIRAMAAGVDEKSEVNFTVYGKGRQPGSTFKPIVYAAAFDSGKYNLYSEVRDSAVKIGSKSFRNYGGGYSNSEMTIENAIAVSKNTIPIKVAQVIGLKRIVDTAHRMGIKQKLPTNDYTLVLGSIEVTPLEMASAFSTFPNGGDHAEPIAVRLAVDAQGNVIERNEPRITKSVIKESTAASIGRALEVVVERGTGKAANTVPGVRGKTGTTSDNKDTWFVGYTRELVAALWASNRQIKPVLDKAGKPVLDKNGKPKMTERYLEMDSDATGGHVSAPIWGRFMSAAVPIQQRAGLEPILLPEDLQKQRLAAAAKTPPTPQPDKINDEGELVVMICEETSKRANAYCHDTVEKVFPKGIVINPCKLHKAPTPEDATTTTASPTPEAREEPTPAPRRRRRRDAAAEEEKRQEEERRQQREEQRARARAEEDSKPRDEEKKPEERGETEVEICSETSKRATAYCPERVTKRFPAGTRVGSCRIHKARTGEEDR